MKIDDVSNMTLEEEENQYKMLIKQLPKKMILESIKELLNTQTNVHEGSIPMYMMFANWSIIMQKFVIDENKTQESEYTQFAKSLRVSQDGIKDEKKYIDRITSLEANNDKSFVIAPVTAKEHIFSTVIYKKDEDNYEFIIINKGERPKENHTHEKYIIPQKKLGNIIKYIEGINTRGTASVGDIYADFKKNSNEYVAMLDIASAPQRESNCYYKEMEAGLKYAYSRSFNAFDTITYLDNKIRIPKLPGGTETFQKAVIDKILESSVNNEEKYEEFIKEVKGLVDIYEKNKEFRKRIDEEGINDTYREKILYDIFGKGYVGSNTGKEYLEYCLSKVDERTLNDNIRFFINIIRKNFEEEYIPMLMYSTRYSNFETDFTHVAKNYFDYTKNYNEIEFLERHFPLVSEKIQAMYIEEYKTKNYGVISNADIVNDDSYLEFVLNERLSVCKEVLDMTDYYYVKACVLKKNGYLNEAAMCFKKAYEEIGVYDNAYVEKIRNKYNEVLDVIQKNKDLMGDLKSIEKGYDNKKYILKLKERADLILRAGNDNKALEKYKEIAELIDKSDYRDNIDVIRKIIHLEENLNNTSTALKECDRLLNNLDLEYVPDILDLKGDLLVKDKNNSVAFNVYKDALYGIKRKEKEVSPNSLEERYNLYKFESDVIRKMIDIGVNTGSLKYPAIANMYKKMKTADENALTLLSKMGVDDEVFYTNIENRINNIKYIDDIDIYFIHRNKEIIKHKEELYNDRNIKALGELAKIRRGFSIQGETDEELNDMLREVKEVLPKIDRKNDETYYLEMKYNKAEILYNLGKEQEAEKEIKDISVELKDNMIEDSYLKYLTETISYEVLSKMVEILRENGKSKRAVNILDQVIPQIPDENAKIKASIDRINCLVDANHRSDALIECDNIMPALKENPKELLNYVKIRMLMAELYQEKGKDRYALEIYYKLLKQFPRTKQEYRFITENMNIYKRIDVLKKRLSKEDIVKVETMLKDNEKVKLVQINKDTGKEKNITKGLEF